MQRRYGRLALVLALALPLAAGCKGKGAVSEPKPIIGRSAETPLTRLEVVQRLVNSQSGLLTLKASAYLEIINQGVLQPKATEQNWAKAQLSKVAEWVFDVRSFTGDFTLRQRREDGPCEVRFHPNSPTAGEEYDLRASGDRFWIIWPKDKVKHIYKGWLDRTSPRPQRFVSWRPQDLIDLFLYNEFLRDPVTEKGAEFMEIWPIYYILTVVRVDRVGMMYSRVWINRQTLLPFCHQLFDADGTILAEAQFTNYVSFNVAGGGKVAVPMNARFIWPLDDLVFEVELSSVTVNGNIEDRWFAPPSEEGAQVETWYPYDLPPSPENAPPPRATPPPLPVHRDTP